MDVTYLEPLRRAWDRMARMLFRPFRLDIWLVLGFSAFLADLGRGGGGGFGWNAGARANLDDAVGWRVLQDRAADLMERPFLVAAIVAAVISLLVLGVLLLWIGSRGTFVFLDNVLHERAHIVEPWRRTRKVGNSLFLWRLGFVLACLVGFAMLVIPAVPLFRAIDRHEVWDVLSVLSVLAWGAGVVVLVVLIVVVAILLDNFVVPIMYAHDVTAVKAWGRLLRLLRAHPGSFLLYGLLVVALGVVVMVAVVIAGFGTCCCGFILLAIPYVGSVLLLPVSVTYRGFGPEFLAQFGPEHALPGSGVAGPVVPPPPSPHPL